MGMQAALKPRVMAEFRILNRGRQTRWSAACNTCNILLGTGPSRSSAVRAVHAHTVEAHPGHDYVIWREKHG